MGHLISRMKKTPVTSRHPDPLVAAAEAMPKAKRSRPRNRHNKGSQFKWTRRDIEELIEQGKNNLHPPGD